MTTPTPGPDSSYPSSWRPRGAPDLDAQRTEMELAAAAMSDTGVGPTSPPCARRRQLMAPTNSIYEVRQVL